MYLVTGASGHLGRLIINSLINKGIQANTIIAPVRTPDKVNDLAELGVVVRQADYNDFTSMQAAFAGAKRAVLVSSSEVGQRLPQHSNVVNAAEQAGLELFAYTSLLRADTSAMILAQEHKATEKLILDKELPYVFLRNGWYNENYTEQVGMALEHGAVLGSASEGKFSTAARADYAEAAATVLSSSEHVGKVYELAGDQSFTLTEYARYVSAAAGKNVVYQNMPVDQLIGAMSQAGLPEPMAKLLADCDMAASQGALFEDSKTLSGLIGRPTTTIQESLQHAL